MKLLTKCTFKTTPNDMIASLMNSKIMEKFVTKCAIKTLPNYMIVSLVNSKIMQGLIKLVTKFTI